MLAALLLVATTCLPGDWHYVPHVPRSGAARHQFMVATGYPHGRPGWIVDHVAPLCAGGADDPSNMQWQTKANAKLKDDVEKSLCRCLRKTEGTLH